MIINPTKKALVVFNKVKPADDFSEAKAFSTENSFFSWHANYYSIDHKKIVILINDLTNAVVVLYDIRANNKMHLDTYITAGVRTAFTLAGISDEMINTYLELAGETIVNEGFNRSVTGRLTNLISKIKEFSWMIDSAVVIQSEAMEMLMRTPFTQEEFPFAIDGIEAAFKNNLQIVESTYTDAPSAPVIKKTWKSYQRWSKYANDAAIYDDLDASERVMTEIQANNKLLLSSFKNYMMDSAGLTKKTAQKHVSRVDFFLNQFLVFDGFKTPLQTTAVIETYLSDWYPREAAYSAADLKSNAGSLKHFIEFLFAADLIDKAATTEGLAAYKVGRELGLMTFEALDSNTDLFW